MTGSLPIRIGIDIGGTNTCLGVVGPGGHCLSRITFETPAKQAPEFFVSSFVKQINKAIDEIEPRYTLVGIGIAAPGVNRDGIIEKPSNLVWDGLDLPQLLSHYFHVPIGITNDANAAALGEAEYGVARGLAHFLMVTLGTGVGGGLVLDGRLYQGADGLAGELGHIRVVPDGRECGCGRRGCLETYTSATGVVRTGHQLLQRNPNKDTPLRGLAATGNLSARGIAEAAENGDPLALEVFTETGAVLGRALADLAAIFDPQAIVLFGGLVKAGDLLMEPTNQFFQLNLLPHYVGRVKLLATCLGSDAAILGASLLPERTPTLPHAV